MTKVHLPMLAANYRSTPKNYGVEIGVQPQYIQYRELINPLGLNWIRYPVMWHKWESTKAGYSVPMGFDSDIAAILEDGSTPVLTVKMAPDWARAPGTQPCHMIQDVEAFARFGAYLAQRYPDVRHFEICNEPDFPTPEYSPYFGCWGDPAKDFYGGLDYARPMNAIYDAIKSVNPANQVWSGGLMLELTSGMKDYFEGMVRGGAKFDAVSYHCYTTYPCCNTYFVEQAHQFLLDTMARLGIDKPLFLSETALISRTQAYPLESDQTHPFYYWQCAYFYNLLEWSKKARNLIGWQWYGLKMGWRNCSILWSADGKPKPVYWAMQGNL